MAHLNLNLIRSKADFIAALIPQAEDAVHPHIFTNAHVELLVADVTKHVAVALADKALSRKGLDLSKDMATRATVAMVSAWDPDDDICPPWPFPIPHWWNTVEGPQPDPWQTVVSAQQIELAQLLNHLSALTAIRESNVALKSLATAVAQSAAGELADDFEQCGTLPRKPFPPKKSLTASAG